jgi:Family of unknown function (DUF6284)
MSMMTPNDRVDQEPTGAELAAIEAEWPLVEAELAVLDAEIAALSAAGGPSPLDWRRWRRAQRRLLAALAAGRAVQRAEAARRAWVLAGRDTEREACLALYAVLYPRPAEERGVAS